MPCHVPACPNPPGPSGFCGLHQNRLNARACGLLDHMALADRIAIAAHPGWRGRPWRLGLVRWGDGVGFYAGAPDRMGFGYGTAAEALYDVDVRNGIPVADLPNLRKRLADMEREAVEQRHRAEAAEDALTDLAAIARGEMADPWPADEAKPDTVGGRAYDAVSRLVTERDAAREALDRQSTTIAGLRSEREAAVAELATARQFAASDAAIIDNLRTGLRLLTDELTLARRPWWARLWAWVTGGGE